MKWYFASRTRHQESISKINKVLLNNGHSVVFDWTELGVLKPFEENVHSCKTIAEDISRSIPHADIFVLISDAAGTDMFVELGIAIAQWTEYKKTKIYVVGKHNKRSLMHFHPSIIHADSLKEVLNKECPGIRLWSGL